MKSIVIHAAKDLRIEERPLEAPGLGQVLIRVAAGGICGSDLHYYHHGGFGAVRLKEPMILGHEVCGYIEQLGAEVAALKVGQLVAVSPSRPCYHCRYCREGQHNHCLQMRFYGSAMPFPHIQGAFSEWLVADAVQCVAADGLSVAEAAMAEPLAVALHATRQAGPLLGKRVLVIGCGPIGILGVISARRAGAAEIVAVDIADFALAMARQAGADIALNTRSDAQALQPYCAEKGVFDVLYECSGVAAALAQGIAALRPGGRIVQIGLGGDMALPMMAITSKEVSLVGSFRFHPEFAIGVELMRKGLLDVKPLVTHTVALDAAVAGFELAGDRSQAIKAQISFG